MNIHFASFEFTSCEHFTTFEFTFSPSSSLPTYMFRIIVCGGKGGCECICTYIYFSVVGIYTYNAFFLLFHSELQMSRYFITD